MKKSFVVRATQGVWINDMRQIGLPSHQWPSSIFDEQTEYGMKAAIDVLSQFGFSILTAFGLFSTYSWPLDIKSCVNRDRDARIKRIIEYAHDHHIRLLVGMGVYSWGFDEIVKNDPAVQGDNPHAMCRSRDASWMWQKKIVDFVLDKYDLDGFHFESADLGRCHCPDCIKLGDAEYHCEINRQTAQYIKKRNPEKTVMVNMCGFRESREAIPVDDYHYFTALSKEIDFLIDPGIFRDKGIYIEADKRPDFMKHLSCSFGTCGGSWTYTPQRWERLRWFLPCVQHSITHIKELYKQGGRALEHYVGPVNNPGIELNIACGGIISGDIDRSIDDVLFEAVETLYKPVNEASCWKLVSLLKRAEDAYYNNVSTNEICEIGLTNMFGEKPTPAAYLLDKSQGGICTSISSSDRMKYGRELMEMLSEIDGMIDSFGSKDKICAIMVCMENVLKEILFIENSFNGGLLYER